MSSRRKAQSEFVESDQPLAHLTNENFGLTAGAWGDDAYDALRHVVFQMFMTGPGWRATWPAFVMGLEEQFRRADTLTGEPAGHA